MCYIMSYRHKKMTGLVVKWLQARSGIIKWKKRNRTNVIYHVTISDIVSKKRNKNKYTIFQYFLTKY